MINRKIIATAPWKVECQNLDENLKVGPEKILVQNRFSQISPGTELACLSGEESWFKIPSTLGYISIGEVVETGTEVKDVKLGDLLFTFNGHSEYALIDSTNDWHFYAKVTVSCDEKLLPFTRLANIAFTSIRVSDIEIGDRVCVVGMGLVGIMAAQLAQLQGADVIGVDLSEARLEAARKVGIQHVCKAGDGIVDRLNTQLDDGISTLIEATGNPKAMLPILPAMKKSGEVILLGSPRGEHEINVTTMLESIHIFDKGNLTFKGAHEWRYPIKKNHHNKHSIERNTGIVMNLIDDGRLQVEPLITHVFKPEDAARAYDGLRNNPDDYIGVLFDWS